MLAVGSAGEIAEKAKEAGVDIVVLSPLRLYSIRDP